jgi:ABC-type transporter Mla subunit MlaD
MSPRPGIFRRLFDIVPSEHRPRPLAIGSAVIALIVLALVSAGLRHIPLTPKSGHVVRAEFTAADQVTNRTVVRVGGIEVGRVDGVQAGSNPYRTSLVSMRITSDKVNLRSDASAAIRWRTLLGGLMYIDLQPGSPSAPPLGGATIAADRTSNQVELDQVLEPYAGPTAEAQRNLLKGLRYGVADPAGIGRTIRTLSPALQTVDRGLEPLRGIQSDDLRGLVAATAKTVHGLGDTAGLSSLVAGANQTLAATDAQRANLGQTIELSPSSLNSTFTTMARVRTTLDNLDPLVARLRPGARMLASASQAAAPALAQTEGVLREARPLLLEAGPTFDALGQASGTGVPLMRALDPTLTRMLSELLPFLRRRDPDTKLRVYETFGPFSASLAMAAGEYDSVGHRIRLTVPPNLNSFVSSAPTGSMTRACGLSRLMTLPDGGARCSQVTQALARGWFGAPKPTSGASR